MVPGHFNAEMTNTHKEEFCLVYNYKRPNCSKNPEKPTTIDHILTNHLRCFQYWSVYETEYSEFQDSHQLF